MPLTTAVTNDTASLDVHASLHNALARYANLAGGVFGTGEDGAFTLDPAVSGPIGPFAHSSTSTTFTLTRDVNLTDLTLVGSARLSTEGYRIYVTGTLAVPIGATVHCDGVSTTSQSGGAATVPATRPAVWFITLNGAAGGGSGANGANATTNPNATMTLGGAGGASGGGQSGGAVTVSGQEGTRATFPRTSLASIPLVYNNTNVVRFTVASGGAGGGATSGSTGGGGGGAGGYVLIWANTIVLDGALSAVGGGGGPGSLGTGTGAGGGGGGGGGLVVLVRRDRRGAGAVSAAGGAGGAGVGSGAPGAAGGSGLIFDLTV